MNDHLKNIGLQIIASNSYELLMGKTKTFLSDWSANHQADANLIQSNQEIATFHKLLDLERAVEFLTESFVPEDLMGESAIQAEDSHDFEENINTIRNISPSVGKRTKINPTANPFSFGQSRNQIQRNVSDSIKSFSPPIRETAEENNQNSQQIVESFENQQIHESIETAPRFNDGLEKMKTFKEADGSGENVSESKASSHLNQESNNPSQDVIHPKTEIGNSSPKTPSYRSFKSLSALAQDINSKQMEHFDPQKLDENSHNIHANDQLKEESELPLKLKRTTPLPINKNHPNLEVSNELKNMVESMLSQEIKKNQSENLSKTSTNQIVAGDNDRNDTKSSYQQIKSQQSEKKIEKGHQILEEGVLSPTSTPTNRPNQFPVEQIVHVQAEPSDSDNLWTMESPEMDVDDVIDSLIQHLNEEYKRFYGPI